MSNNLKDKDNDYYLLSKPLKETFQGLQEDVDPNEFEDEEVKAYIQDIMKYPKLSMRDSYLLALRVKMGSRSAAAELINGNLMFVVNCAKYYAKSGVSVMDLIQEGNVGLVEAVEKFDVYRSDCFIGFARYSIINKMKRYIGKNSSVVSVTHNLYYEIDRICKFEKDYKSEHGVLPDEDTVCSGVGITKQKYQLYKKNKVFDINVISSLKPVFVEGEKVCIQDVIPFDSEDYERELNDIECCSMRDEVLNCMKHSLTEHDYKFVYYYFGFDGVDRGIEEVGNMLHVTRERVRQVVDKSLRRMRNPAASHYLKVYVTGEMERKKIR